MQPDRGKTGTSVAVVACCCEWICSRSLNAFWIKPKRRVESAELFVPVRFGCRTLYVAGVRLMAIPDSSDARLYYRCAYLRCDEAKVLLKAGYTTGAVYLAGYGIVCILKALVIMAVPASDRPSTLKLFRGNKAHEYEWLRSLYLTRGGLRFPREITRHFTLVNDWSTDLRYTPRTVREHDAEAFLASSIAIIKWADGRI